MIKKYKDYIILLSLFLLFIFTSNINSFLDSNLSKDNIELNYNNYLKEELNNLNKLYNIDYISNIDILVSKVKYRNVYEFRDILTIYKGFKDNIKKGDAILTNDGLIGFISKTYEHSSLVTLITNKKSNISVKINNSIGVLKYNGENLIVDNVSNYENIIKGDLIYTSGLGNLPDNIYVGKVKSVSLKTNGIEKVIEVDIDNRLENLNYLYIWRINHD